MACIYNTVGHTVGTDDMITACSTSTTSRYTVTMVVDGGQIFSSCHTLDTINDALTPPAQIGDYLITCGS